MVRAEVIFDVSRALEIDVGYDKLGPPISGRRADGQRDASPQWGWGRLWILPPGKAYAAPDLSLLSATPHPCTLPLLALQAGLRKVQRPDQLTPHQSPSAFQSPSSWHE